MKNSKVLFLDLVSRIKIDESLQEIQSIVYILLETLLNVSRADILTQKEIVVGQSEQKKIDQIIDRINKQEPLQYILGETEFYGRKFTVNPAVLIPRPETEELVRYVISYRNSINHNGAFRILDVGTGSGCIAATLALEIPESEVFATDVSQAALDVARENAQLLNATVSYVQSDVLQDEIPFNQLNLIISNPPYIAQSEKGTMRTNVVAFEPHLALFVSDDDALQFYRSIAEKSRHKLRQNGLLVVEINERFGKEVTTLFEKYGFTDVQVIQDLFGKERIVKGILKV